MIVVFEIPRTIDLTSFVEVLRQSRIPHRINESGEMQVLWVMSEIDKQKVLRLYEHFQAGSIVLPEASRSVSAQPNRLLREALLAPLTLTLIVANIICFPITNGADTGQFSAWLHAFTLLDFQLMEGKLYFASLASTLQAGEYWRLLTPMFLHFGWVHIVFNLLWLWEIGRRIEWVNGGLVLSAVVLVSSLFANLLQYLMGGASLFGGMSGVVFGLLGFSWYWSWQIPERSHGLRSGIYVFMLVFLVVGFTGVFDLLGLGSLANGAHLGGLLGGLIVAGLAQLIYILRRKLNI